jgi:hypothetical protein
MPVRTRRRGLAPVASCSACARSATGWAPQPSASSRASWSRGRASARWLARRSAAPSSVRGPPAARDVDLRVDEPARLVGVAEAGERERGLRAPGRVARVADAEPLEALADREELRESSVHVTGGDSDPRARVEPLRHLERRSLAFGYAGEVQRRGAPRRACRARPAPRPGGRGTRGVRPCRPWAGWPRAPSWRRLRPGRVVGGLAVDPLLQHRGGVVLAALHIEGAAEGERGLDGARMAFEEPVGLFEASGGGQA